MDGIKKRTLKKLCIVPKCTVNSKDYPEKRFIALPKDEKRRRRWLQAMRKDVKTVSSTYICEDHFNLEEDAENWIKLKYYPGCKTKLKPGVVPHIFECQPDRRAAQPRKERQTSANRARRKLLESVMNAYSTPSSTVTSGSDCGNIVPPPFPGHTELPSVLRGESTYTREESETSSTQCTLPRNRYRVYYVVRSTPLPEPPPLRPFTSPIATPGTQRTEEQRDVDAQAATVPFGCYPYIRVTTEEQINSSDTILIKEEVVYDDYLAIDKNIISSQLNTGDRIVIKEEIVYDDYLAIDDNIVNSQVNLSDNILIKEEVVYDHFLAIDDNIINEETIHDEKMLKYIDEDGDVTNEADLTMTGSKSPAVFLNDVNSTEEIPWNVSLVKEELSIPSGVVSMEQLTGLDVMGDVLSLDKEVINTCETAGATDEVGNSSEGVAMEEKVNWSGSTLIKEEIIDDLSNVADDAYT